MVLLKEQIRRESFTFAIQITRWVPVYTGADKMLAVMSIGFLLEHKDDAVVWRGPKKNGISNFYFIDL